MLNMKSNNSFSKAQVPDHELKKPNLDKPEPNRCKRLKFKEQRAKGKGQSEGTKVKENKLR